MHLERHVAIVLLASAIAACSGAEVSTANAEPARQPPMRMEVKPVSGNEFIEAASRAALIEGYKVVTAQSQGRIAAVVLYRAGDARENPPACAFSVVENYGDGVKVVGSSGAIIECPLDSSPEEVQAAITLVVGSESVTIERDAANGNEAFLLERGMDGIWYVTKASYTRSEEQATGDMVVSVEEAIYPTGSNGVALDKYSYAVVEKDLVKRVVE
jgi:hypothetical protein